MLVRLSQLMIDRPEMAELDINPLLSFSIGAMTLDARVVGQAADMGMTVADVWQGRCLIPWPASKDSRMRCGWLKWPAGLSIYSHRPSTGIRLKSNTTK
ncbi:MAG: acetate--CoA ligase family protein [Desulfarculaceae bacterium]